MWFCSVCDENEEICGAVVLCLFFSAGWVFTYLPIWSFNALSQALGTDRGTDIVISHRATQDGIAAYHMMVVRYHFGGDIETFKKK